MKTNQLILLICILLSTLAYSQTSPQLLRGVVLYKNTPVPNQNVINITTEIATITDENGTFLIEVSPGDRLAFMSLNYELQTVDITQEIIDNRRFNIEVNEKVTELDEVVITPEDREAFLKQRSEEFSQYYYERDASTRVQNQAIPTSQRGMIDGLNIGALLGLISKAIFKSNNKDVKSPILPSQVMRQLYDDRFFIVDLKLPPDQIDAFLYYLDDKHPAKELFNKDRELDLIDFMVKESANFLTLSEATDDTP